MLLYILTLVSSVAFLFYGFFVFVNSGMKKEFERYGLIKFRKFIGSLQVLGGVGLLAGLVWNPFLIIASGGLSLLMMIGFGVRLRMKDGFLESMPSFLFMLFNGYICFFAMYH